MTESAIQAGIIQYLGYLERSGRGYFFRNNSFAGHVIRRDGSKGFINNNKRGTPDIVGLYLGRFVGIEVKAPKGQQTDLQKEAEAHIRKAGGIYILARSIDDVSRIIERLDAHEKE